MNGWERRLPAPNGGYNIVTDCEAGQHCIHLRGSNGTTFPDTSYFEYAKNGSAFRTCSSECAEALLSGNLPEHVKQAAIKRLHLKHQFTLEGGVCAHCGIAQCHHLYFTNGYVFYSCPQHASLAYQELTKGCGR